MLESAAPFALMWAAFLAGTTIGLMVLVRPYVLRTARRRWAAFVLLSAVAFAFFGVAVVGVYVWPALREVMAHTVGSITFVGFVLIYVELTLFVSLIVLPMKQDRTPRRGGFCRPQQGP